MSPSSTPRSRAFRSLRYSTSTTFLWTSSAVARRTSSSHTERVPLCTIRLSVIRPCRPYFFNCGLTSGSGIVLLLGKGVINRKAFMNWLREVLQRHGERIYRLKGILRFEGSDSQFILQGVHSTFDLTAHPTKTWPASVCSVFFSPKA